MYKEASKQNLRFTTTKGNLTVEQLWSLSTDELNNLAVTLDEQYNESGKKSFLVTKSVKDKTAKLRFDIALDILNTKLEEAEAIKHAKEVKEHNKKIISLIQEKKDESLKGKTIKQLEAMLKD
jgi:hypothetical protein